MSHTHLPNFHAERKYIKFQDTQANAMKQGAAPGTMEKFEHGQRMKEDKNKDVDTVASDFIKHKHRAWALQKSTTMYPPS
uniref:Uncharacterized protein n=1 Tax=Arundo donax TaxID=35708 RepID=A0A0A8XSI3_ARUDO